MAILDSLHLCSIGNPGYSSLESVTFVVNPDDEKGQRRVTIRPGSWVLGAVERFDAGDEAVEDTDVAFVGEVLQVNALHIKGGRHLSVKASARLPLLFSASSRSCHISLCTMMQDCADHEGICFKR